MITSLLSCSAIEFGFITTKRWSLSERHRKKESYRLLRFAILQLSLAYSPANYGFVIWIIACVWSWLHPILSRVVFQTVYRAFCFYLLLAEQITSPMLFVATRPISTLISIEHRSTVVDFWRRNQKKDVTHFSPFPVSHVRAIFFDETPSESRQRLSIFGPKMSEFRPCEISKW